MYGTTFIFSKMLLQLLVVEVAWDHQNSKMNGPSLHLRLFDDLCLAVGFCHLLCCQLFKLFTLSELQLSQIFQ